jgi:D-glycerate 3-kinase
VDVIILEGWCVGAVAQSDEALEQPVNDLERLEDPLGTWRGHVNRELAGRYRELTEELDYLVLLAAPSFDVVYDWRRQQENSLRKAGLKGGPITSGIMNDRALARFIAHYERLTRHILAEMPARADLVVLLDSQRRIVRTAPVLR